MGIIKNQVSDMPVVKKQLIFSSSSLDFSLYYKVELDKKYGTIKLFHNGDEASFGSVSPLKSS
ncbi:hypothetical protein [Sutcliffiella horikoshii]|uniref:hypothetical protein n=1 Tax=Sutcliffiella horikoshii TaxID=79883 RepID=UPI00384AE5AC